jgi:serine/threonine-protein kinase
VLDFGISKVTAPDGKSDMGMTKTQAIMGSPLYMSPEQMASSRDVDARSDIWAAGTVLYELVTGRVPFQAETMPQLCAMILQHDPPPPRSFQPGIPEGLQQVILRSLRKQRADRYQNVAEFAAALAEFAPNVGPRSAQRIARVLGGGAPSLSTSDLNQARAVSQPGGSTGAEQAWGTTMTHRRGKALWVTLGGIAVVGAAAAAFFVLGGKPPDPAIAKPEQAPAAAAAPVEPPKVDTTPTVAPVATPEVTTSAAPSATPEPAPAPVKTTARVPKKGAPKPAPDKPAPAAPKPDPTPSKTVDPLGDRR